MTDPVAFESIFRKWLTSALYGVAVIVACLIVSPFIMPANDPWSLFRYFILRVPAAVWGIIAMTGGVLFFDRFTPGDWLKKAEDGNVACSIVLVGIILAIALILCYA